MKKLKMQAPVSSSGSTRYYILNNFHSAIYRNLNENMKTFNHSAEKICEIQLQQILLIIQGLEEEQYPVIVINDRSAFDLCYKKLKEIFANINSNFPSHNSDLLKQLNQIRVLYHYFEYKNSYRLCETLSVIGLQIAMASKGDVKYYIEFLEKRKIQLEKISSTEYHTRNDQDALKNVLHDLDAFKNQAVFPEESLKSEKDIQEELKTKYKLSLENFRDSKTANNSRDSQILREESPIKEIENKKTPIISYIEMMEEGQIVFVPSGLEFELFSKLLENTNTVTKDKLDEIIYWLEFIENNKLAGSSNNLTLEKLKTISNKVNGEFNPQNIDLKLFPFLKYLNRLRVLYQYAEDEKNYKLAHVVAGLALKVIDKNKQIPKIWAGEFYRKVMVTLIRICSGEHTEADKNQLEQVKGKYQLFLQCVQNDSETQKKDELSFSKNMSPVSTEMSSGPSATSDSKQENIHEQSDNKQDSVNAKAFKRKSKKKSRKNKESSINSTPKNVQKLSDTDGNLEKSDKINKKKIKTKAKKELNSILNRLNKLYQKVKTINEEIDAEMQEISLVKHNSPKFLFSEKLNDPFVIKKKLKNLADHNAEQLRQFETINADLQDIFKSLQSFESSSAQEPLIKKVENKYNDIEEYIQKEKAFIKQASQKIKETMQDIEYVLGQALIQAILEKDVKQVEYLLKAEVNLNITGSTIVLQNQFDFPFGQAFWGKYPVTLFSREYRDATVLQLAMISDWIVPFLMPVLPDSDHEKQVERAPFWPRVLTTQLSNPILEEILHILEPIVHLDGKVAPSKQALILNPGEPAYQFIRKFFEKAPSSESLEILELLLQHKADPYLPSWWGERAIDTAAWLVNSNEVRKLLQKYNADISKQPESLLNIKMQNFDSRMPFPAEVYLNPSLKLAVTGQQASDSSSSKLREEENVERVNNNLATMFWDRKESSNPNCELNRD